MKEVGVVAKMKRKFKVRTTDSNHNYNISPNRLQRDFRTNVPDYASDSHRELLEEYDILQNMSKKGDCWDNAVSESFFHSLKTELVHHERFKTRAEANQAIFEYIEVFYDRQRLHSTNNYMSPVNYELKMLEYQTAG